MENEILELIRKSSDPEKALSIAIELAIILDKQSTKCYNDSTGQKQPGRKDII